MVWGVTVPWTLLLSAGLGAWLMLAPTVLDIHGGSADSDHLIGALVITVAIVAMAEVTRAVRFLNVGLSVWLLLAPWVLHGSTAMPWNDMTVGLALALLSLPRGRITERYGAWDRYIL